MDMRLSPEDRPFMGKRGWTILIGVNLVAGLLLWVGYLTDWSLAGTIPDLLFPLFVGLLGYYTLLAAQGAPHRQRRSIIWACAPSLVGGAAYLLAGILLFMPPFTFDSMFHLAEITSERVVEKEPSPDGRYIAQVVFRGAAAAPGASGEIVIRVVPRAFPLVERELGAVRVYFTNEEVERYVMWQDAGALTFLPLDWKWPAEETRFALPLLVVGPGRPLAGLAGEGYPPTPVAIPLTSQAVQSRPRGGVCCVGPIIIPLFFPPLFWHRHRLPKEPSSEEDDCAVFW